MLLHRGPGALRIGFNGLGHALAALNLRLGPRRFVVFLCVVVLVTSCYSLRCCHFIGVFLADSMLLV